MDIDVDHVLVAMGDPEVADVGRPDPGRSDTVRLVEVDIQSDGELPLGHARNVGAASALRRGAELLVFLDVDCLPTARLVDDYLDAVLRADAGAVEGPVLWCGEVAYLPPLPAGVQGYPLDSLDAWASPHPARPSPARDTTRFSTDMRLFWSLNFAITARDWQFTGGFCREYVGYGGEDTDLAMTVGAQGGAIGWVGGARAYHQYHPTSSPPWHHLPAIVRNARIFRKRWGWFPMEGWLTAFAEAGAVDFRPGEDVLEIIPRS